MLIEHELKPTGTLALRHSRNGYQVLQRRKVPFWWVLTQNWDFIRSYVLGHIQTGIALLANRLFGIVTITSELRIERFDHLSGVIWDYGVTSRRVVTDAFVALLIDACDTGASPALDLFNFGAFGTSTAVEAATDTGMTTELTTQYATDNTRPTGTISQPSASQYRMVVTLAPDATVTVQ